MARSLIASAQQDVIDNLIDLFELAGAEARKGVSFSGWTPNPESSVLKTAQTTYRKLFDKTPTINVIHAGLECGLLGQAYPHWDMVSFGPTIRGAHSPDERVNVESVDAFWRYLCAVLEDLA
jgi:dipeptidase D